MTGFQPPTARDFHRRWSERVGWRYAKNAERTMVAITGAPVDEQIVQALHGMFAKSLRTIPPDPRLQAASLRAKNLRRRIRQSEGEDA